LYFICLHYLLFDRQAVSGALAYVSRRFPGSGFFKARLHIYRLFISQGKQLIDRYAAVSGNVLFDIRAEGVEPLIELLRGSQQGFILLTAHVGNWQMALTALKNLNRTVHLVMRAEDNTAVESSLHISKESGFIRLISPEAEMDGVLKIMNALKQGDVVSIMGDRKYNFDALPASFLKDQAYFPYGAFAIAAAAQCPVVVLLSARVSHKKYLVDVSNVLRPRYKGNAGKREQLRGFVQEFAAVLEKYTGQYPYQCFLFHDIWKK
jgi:predicted LPLAT superfamily acyltransferase